MDISGISGNGMAEGLTARQLQIQNKALTQHNSKVQAIDQKVKAYQEVDTRRDALITALKKIAAAETLGARQLELADKESKVAKVSVAPRAELGTYRFDVVKMATSSQIQTGERLAEKLYSASVTSDSDETGPLLSALALSGLKEGTVTLQVGNFSTSTLTPYTVDLRFSDTLQDFFKQIETVTAGDVKAAYDATTDKITLQSANGKDLLLGSPGNTSNFFEVAHLFSAKNPSSTDTTPFSISSDITLGKLNLSAPITESRLLDGSISEGTQTLTINGTAIEYDPSKETLNSLMHKVAKSGANARLSYNPATDTVTLSNAQTGALGIEMSDTGSLLTALKLTSSSKKLSIGENAQFKLNQGPTLTAATNELGENQHGVSGLTLTLQEIGSTTVTINPNTAPAEEALQGFIDAYNAFADFVKEKTKISTQGTQTTTGPLSQDQELKKLASDLRLNAISKLDIANSTIENLGAIGIGTSDKPSDPKLSLDKAQLNQELLGHPSDVLSALETASKRLLDPLNAHVNRYKGADKKTPQARLLEEKTRIQEQKMKVQKQMDTLKVQSEQSMMRAQMAFENSQRQLAALSSFNR